MNFDQEIDITKLKYNSRLIVERVRARGWKIANFKSNPGIFLITVPGKQKPIKIFSASPPQTSYPASKIAKDKYITSQLLNLEGLPVPNEILLNIKNDLPEDEIHKFIDKHKKTVIKPLDAAHGKGITTNITSVEQAKKAIEDLRPFTQKNLALIQQQLEGFDIRILCIDYKFADAISRIPAGVTGDGIHTIKELLDQENSSEHRGENYKAKLNYISVEKATAYLGLEQMDSIPVKGERISVTGVSNVGQGGERHNIKQDIPVFLAEYAERASRALELPICGVDFIVKRLPVKNDTVTDIYPVVIEVNTCPSLIMKDDLYSEEQAEITDSYLDFLAAKND